jgi:hypothetical protein
MGRVTSIRHEDSSSNGKKSILCPDLGRLTGRLIIRAIVIASVYAFTVYCVIEITLKLTKEAQSPSR